MTPGIVLGTTAETPRHNDVLALPESLRGGDATQCSYAISSIQMQEEDPIPLANPGVTAIVGGNNAGKSTLLRQIREMSSISPGMPEDPGPPHLLTAMDSTKVGTVSDLAAWLLHHADLVASPDGRPLFQRYGAQHVDPQLLAHLWGGGTQLGTLSSHLVHYADARDRHSWTVGTGRRAIFTDPPTHPIHNFEFDEDRLAEISGITERAFGHPLTIDRLSGQVFFRVGAPGCEAPPIDRPSAEYQAAIASLPPLDQQGDGMVFMLGALIPIVAATFPVILLDEPEAFLHPPQAYMMGQALADVAAKRRLQLIVATHDRNILRGLLAVSTADVSILRLSRAGSRTAARLLPVDQVRKISNDNVLRHTNILDGLFHRLVVLAENERDCHFYQAALEHLDGRESLPIAPHDVLFIPTNGKGNMAAIAYVLKDTGVRIVTSPDLDLLNNRTVLRKLITALGGEWNQYLDSLYTRATNQFQVPQIKRLNKDVRISVLGVLDEDANGVFDSDRSLRVSAALKVSNPWDALKQQGVSAMNADKEARRELIGLLDSAGVVTVEVGELENFDREVSRSSKDAWLHEALEHGTHTTEPVAAHIRRLLGVRQP